MQKEYGKSRIHTPDIPGAGPYSKEVSPANFDDMVYFLRNKHRKALLNGGHALLGVSLGGMLAKRWTELYPNDFKKVVLVNTSFRAIVPIYQRLRPSAVRDFARITQRPTIKQREKAILNLVINERSIRKELLPTWIEIQRSAPIKKLSAFNQLMAALTYLPDRNPPPCEVMLLASKKDRLCSYKSSQRIHQLWPNSQLHLHPKAGHELSAEDPQWVLEKLKQFF